MKPQSSNTNRAGRFWAWVPALLLGSMLAGLGTLTCIAVNDPHFALEPDYYAKAVKWDRTQAQAAESAASGIQLSLLQPLTADAGGHVELRVNVVDREHAPLTQAQVQLEAFPNAYASRIQRAVLRELEPGVYGCQLERAGAGLWELRLNVTQGSRSFRQVLRQDIGKGPSA